MRTRATGYDRQVIPAARIEETGDGLRPIPPGWFVHNARESLWRRRPGRGHSAPFTGWSDEECETHFARIGIGMVVVEPGEPTTLYHWENDQEDFLVIAGEAILIVEGEERRLRRWDFVHCPPGTKHAFIGAGTGPCTILAIGSREHVDKSCHGGAYAVDEAALRYGAGVEKETNDARVAYSRFAASEPAWYQSG
jgi:uncharacterized cupin superfamily protein